MAETASSTPLSSTSRAATDRERFVAFAFCSADALLELDAEARIVYAAGTVQALTGRRPVELTGTGVDTLVAGPDRVLAREMIALARRHGRIDNTTLRIEAPDGAVRSLSFSGYRLDDFDGHFFFAIRAHGGTQAASEAGEIERDAGTGLYKPDDFSALAAERLKAVETEGEKAEVTLISMPEMPALRERLDDEAKRSLGDSLAMAMRANSLGGDFATEVSEGRYAILHEAGLDVRGLERHLSEMTRELDPDGKGVSAEGATLDVAEQGLGEEDLANGLVYVINQFRETRGARFSLTSFASNLKSMVDQATRTVHGFRKVLDGASFDIAFHPIVGVTGGKVHHYEALVRFQDANPTESPFKMITFAEEIGLIWQFDIAMARKVVEWLAPRRAKNYKIAVNISGQSVASEPYRDELFELLAQNPWTREHMLFEITESARIADLSDANGFFQSIRKQGYEVCLDDFGAGAASFQYLASLDVDVVKLDGSAVKNALVARKGRAFLTALTKLCRDIGVETVAEMIDDAETLNFVRDCGVDFAQGYLFGKPSTDIDSFAKTGLPRLGR